MNAQANHPPSLFNGGPTAALTPTSGSTPREARTLLDLMYDGFYLLFLLRAKQGPGDAETFRSHIKEFLTGLERGRPDCTVRRKIFTSANTRSARRSTSSS